MRKRLKAQIGARKKQGVSADVEIMDDDLKDMLDSQTEAIERRIENVIAQV
jgi:transposase